MGSVPLVLALIVGGVVTANARSPGGQQAEHRPIVLGVGIGLGWVKAPAATVTVGSLTSQVSRRLSDLSFATDIRIGQARSDRTLLYAALRTTRAQYYSLNGRDWGALALAGVGVTHKLKPRSPTVYLDASAGLAMTADTTADAVMPTLGAGLTLGAGYQFGKHLSLGTEVLFASFPDRRGDMGAFKVSLNILAF